MKNKWKIILFLATLAVFFFMLITFDFTISTNNSKILLAKSYRAMKKIDGNFQMDVNLSGGLSFDMETDGASIKMNIPIDVFMDVSVINNSMGGKMDMEASMDMSIEYEDQKTEQSDKVNKRTDFYTIFNNDRVVTYLKSDDNNWLASTKDFKMIGYRDLLSQNAFRDAKVQKEDGCYILSAKIANLIKDEKFVEFCKCIIKNNIGVDVSNENYNIEKVESMLGESSIICKFDNKYRLIEISTDEVVIDIAGLLDEDAMEGLGLSGINPDDIKAFAKLTIGFKNFGGVSEKSIEVSQEIKKEAFANPNSNIDTGIGEDQDSSVSDDKLSDDWSDLDVMIDGVIYRFPYDYDLLKSNGWAVDLTSMGYENGHMLNKNEKLSSTIYLYNSKYNSVNAWDVFTFWCGFKNFSDQSADITDCDLWCIDLNIMNNAIKVEKFPDVKIAKGITWGSTMGQVVEAFGDPSAKYESNVNGYNCTRLEWITEDGGRCMTLTVDPILGVTAIEFDNYG